MPHPNVNITWHFNDILENHAMQAVSVKSKKIIYFCVILCGCTCAGTFSSRVLTLLVNVHISVTSCPED